MSFWKKHLSAFQRSAIRAACVDMWEPYRQSIEQWEQAKLLKMVLSNCKIDAVTKNFRTVARDEQSSRMWPDGG